MRVLVTGASGFVGSRLVPALLERGHDVVALVRDTDRYDGPASVELIAQLAERVPAMVTPKWVRTESQPIFVDDVIDYLVGVLDAPEAAGETYEIGGPDVLTYQEILRRTAELLTGPPPLIVPVPVLSPRLSARWLSLVTNVSTNVARPLVEGMRNTVVVTDHSIESHVEIEPTPFDEASQRALGDRAVLAEAGEGPES